MFITGTARDQPGRASVQYLIKTVKNSDLLTIFGILHLIGGHFLLHFVVNPGQVSPLRPVLLKSAFCRCPGH